MVQTHRHGDDKHVMKVSTLVNSSEIKVNTGGEKVRNIDMKVSMLVNMDMINIISLLSRCCQL